MEIDHETLRALLSAAKRAPVTNSIERYAIHDAEQLLAADDLDRYPVVELPAAQRNAEQLKLFDTDPYDTH